MFKAVLKSVISLMILITLAGCTPLEGKTPIRESSTLVRHMGSSTVSFVRRGHNGEVGTYCTGVWVSPTVILTANHCIEAEGIHTLGLQGEEAKNIPISLLELPMYYAIEGDVSLDEGPSKVYVAKVMAVDISHDLALVVVKGKAPHHQYAKLPNELPGIGEHVYMLGHPKGLYYTYVEGVVSSYRESMDELGLKGPFMQVNGTIWFGNSGGGVFDSSGNLLGIASRLVKVPNMCFYIHVDSIRKLLLAFEVIGK